jgi:hypothetical protein
MIKTIVFTEDDLLSEVRKSNLPRTEVVGNNKLDYDQGVVTAINGKNVKITASRETDKQCYILGDGQVYFKDHFLWRVRAYLSGHYSPTASYGLALRKPYVVVVGTGENEYFVYARDTNELHNILYGIALSRSSRKVWRTPPEE